VQGVGEVRRQFESDGVERMGFVEDGIYDGVLDFGREVGHC
jgi:hypothetical protein